MQGLEEKVLDCIGILERIYGHPVLEGRDPLDLLVITILSQNTSDTNSERAFAALKEAYPDYGRMLLAPTKEVASQIRPGGLSKIKAPRIKEGLARVLERAGSMDLGFLGDMSLEEGREFLLSLPGVGPKTAAVVLLFGFGLPTMPVDTHVHRVASRLGLVPQKASIERAQEVLEGVVPPDKYLSMHLNLIKHGRAVCRARSPLCSACALDEICNFRQHGQKD
ncbi:MAG: endonuclease III [Methanotrichaceae archaeon]|nr:endonuclease III [Methanotrichaceae archaeon]